ncbi:M3 family metallopeptidase [Actinomyces sp. ZJ308]|uniref:M3 family metallopeptidase n=1 Tax=Actinomyces sp. ZJ308 TaxID=2708342 RepID=UPI00141F1386|nr:M3 family metallopeptidase [Actinomyces sp. ZJ308]
MSETTDGTDLPESNVFARPWPLDLELPGFTAVDHADIEPAIRAGMAAERQEWEAIATNEAEPTIANTVDALERSGELLERALTVLDALTSATECPDLDALEEALAPELAAHSDAYHLDSRLYRRFKVLDDLVAAAPDGQDACDADDAVIDAETARLIRLTVEEFERNGVGLEESDAAALKEINARVNALKMRFSVLATEAMHAAKVTNVTVPPTLATTRPHGARLALLERSMSRGLGGRDSAGDTRSIVLQLAALRAERAALLGYPHHAALVAAESAARTTEAVSEMLARLTPPAMANARRDAQVYAARMDHDPQTRAGEAFGPADWPLYEAAERKDRFGVDDEVLAPYLELWSVITKGVFYAANRLYGITFHEREDLAEHMYAPGVRVWEVRDGAEPDAPVLGLFVGDYYARAGKSGGAWMDSLVTGSRLTGRRPVVINCCNIEQPTSGPALLTWDEVITCFHEFGHALHALLSEARYPSAFGTAVPRDVVEFPSQLNEKWALHPEVLAGYARHVDTGEPLPAELAERLRGQGTFGQGYATTEYLGAALLDQAWHTLAPGQVPGDVNEVEQFEHRALAEAGVNDALVPPRYRTTYFSHIFAGGYSAAYYAYIWSEVMDADAITWFTTDGAIDGDLGLNRRSGETFRREFLARGDSRDPLDSYRAFTGREPSILPLLKRRGLT